MAWLQVTWLAKQSISLTVDELWIECRLYDQMLFIENVQALTCNPLRAPCIGFGQSPKQLNSIRRFNIYMIEAYSTMEDTILYHTLFLESKLLVPRSARSYS